MRLTFINFLNKRQPHGKRFRGKNRVVKQITYEEMCELRHDFEREERNMLFLRHPYLKVQQEVGYMAELKSMRPPYTPLCGKLRDIKFTRTISFEETLSHLKVKENWD